ncbi:MAG TPA: SBBP repeat-containing protein, partial [Pyrinomonadaceae bacterium]|nr:SBBP repeat-containing protein [Pyrinomonadaceae bacterium]
EARPAKTDPDANVREGTILRLKMLGANVSSKAEGQDELPGKVNYFTGNDPENWQRDVPTYKKALFKNVYPGIDVVYYGKQHELEYDFIVAAGANPKLIRFTVEGADKTILDKSGSLRLSLNHGEVSLNKPVIYQVDEEGSHREIKGEYVIKGNEIRFKLAQFDSSRPLIIDPVLSYSTMLGSSSNDTAFGIAVDTQGNAYVTGTTDSTTFPTTAGSFKSTTTRSGAFVTKLNSTGSALIYSTYLSGEGFTSGTGIDVDAAGNAHVTRNTSASDFPIVNGLKTTSNFFRTTDAAANWNNQNSGISGSVSAIAVAPSAPTTIYACSSTGFFRSTDGGATWTKRLGTGFSSFFSVNALAVDPSNASVVYVGNSSGLLKTTNAGDNWTSLSQAPLSFSSVVSIVFDPSTPATIYVGGSGGVFKSTNSGSTWITQNNFGVPGTPTVRALAIHPSAPLTIYAGTSGSGFFKSTNGGGIWTQMNTGMTGESATNVSAIAIDPVTPATIYTGHGFSSFNGSIHKSVNGGSSWTPLTNGVPNAGVTAMTATSSGVFAAMSSGGIIKTTNGGTNWTDANAGLWSIGVVSLVRHPSDPSILYAGTGASGVQDAFVTKLNSSGSGVLFSTLVGGNREEVGNGIAVDGSGNIVVVGHTNSANFPLANAVRSTFNECSMGFVTKINPAVPSYTFSTYLGGSRCGDIVNAVATDGSGNVYVTGRTTSEDFPIANAFQPAFTGPSFAPDAFVTKLTPAGALIFSTYLGAFGSTDMGFGIAADTSGNAYVTGFTESLNFPTKNPIQ